MLIINYCYIIETNYTVDKFHFSSIISNVNMVIKQLLYQHVAFFKIRNMLLYLDSSKSSSAIIEMNIKQQETVLKLLNVSIHNTDEIYTV